MINFNLKRLVNEGDEVESVKNLGRRKDTCKLVWVGPFIGTNVWKKIKTQLLKRINQNFIGKSSAEPRRK